MDEDQTSDQSSVSAFSVSNDALKGLVQLFGKEQAINEVVDGYRAYITMFIEDCVLPNLKDGDL